MALLDKAKESATRLAEQAKDKFAEVKGRRRADGLLEELGKIVYRQRTGRVEPTDEPEIERLVAELKSLDAAAASTDTSTSVATDESPETKFVPEAPPPADV
jgi:hypothetical protein